MIGTILLVEDDPDDALLTRLALGNTVVTVTTGEKALDYLKRNAPPMLLLVDLGLPLMSGVELIHTVRSTPETAHIPIVILTGRADDAETYQALGADAYLTKPLDLQQLTDALRLHGLSLGIIRRPD